MPLTQAQSTPPIAWGSPVSNERSQFVLQYSNTVHNASSWHNYSTHASEESARRSYTTRFTGVNLKWRIRQEVTFVETQVGERLISL